jgi:hypothetical protein
MNESNFAWCLLPDIAFLLFPAIGGFLQERSSFYLSKQKITHASLSFAKISQD